MKIIFGLGNPGLRYRRTRHNAGYRVVDEIAGRFHARFHRAKISKALTAQFHLEGKPANRQICGPAPVWGEPVVLVKPLSFMNLSGSVVSEFMNYFRLKVSDVIVVVDDIYLKTGIIRVRGKGSSGGHNGLESIEDEIGTSGFMRVRVGVGPETPLAEDMAGYVLDTFSRGEEKSLEPALKEAADAVIMIVKEGLSAAMNAHNKRQ